MEDRDDVLVLIDEEGEEQEFEYVGTIEMESGEYVVLLPYDDNGQAVEEEFVILKIEHDGGDECLVNVHDDDELSQVYEAFKMQMEDEFDFMEEE